MTKQQVNEGFKSNTFIFRFWPEKHEQSPYCFVVINVKTGKKKGFRRTIELFDYLQALIKADGEIKQLELLTVC